MKFEDKVKSMKAYEIIQAMMKSLENPTVKLDLTTYGEVKEKNIMGLFKREVCYGCAATNTICQISGIKLNVNNISFRSNRSQAINSDYNFLESFEYAIDSLRRGDITNYNHYAEKHGFAKIVPHPTISMPELENGFTKTQLGTYAILALYQISLQDGF